MTDQTIPADVTPEDMEHARSYVQDYLDAMYAPDRTLAVARVLRALLPSPPRPTLADMTEEERRECRRMQADVEAWGRAVIVLPNAGGGRAVTLDRRGHVTYEDHASVTPRPDLPRMTWPGDQQPAPAPALPEGWRLADHETLGRVLVTSASTSSDGDGYVYILAPTDDPRGYNWIFCPTNRLTFLDTEPEADTSDAVPENTLAEGSEWGDADALARACRESERDQIIALDHPGDAYVWSEAAQSWESVSPMSMNGPFTIIHDGKKAHQ